MNPKNIKSMAHIICIIMLVSLMAGLIPAGVHASGGTATVSNVTSSTSPGSYSVGSHIQVSVVFDEAVTVSGAPSLCFETGATDQCVTYTAGSGTTTLAFIDYIVQSGDTSARLDYVGTAALTLPGGATIKTAAAPLNSAVLTLPALGSSALYANNYVIDTTAPVITITNPNTNPAVNKTITASVTDGTLTMSDTTGLTCDGTLTFVAYTSQTFTLEADNGKKVCYKAVDALGNTGYSMSNAITGIDVTAPAITITNPSTSPAQSKTITASIPDGTLTMSNTIGLTCDGTLTFVAYTPQTFTSEADIGKKVCYKSIDTATNTAYLMSAAIAGIDTTLPTILISDPSPTSTNSGPVTYTVTYTDTNFYASTLAIGNITLNKTDSADGVVATVAGTGNTRTVTINSITGAGTLGITIAASTATDTAGNNAPSATSATFSVSKLNQTITFNPYPYPSATVAGTAYTPTATATSNLTVTFTIDGGSILVCKITSGVVEFLSIGTCVINANQAGNASYNAAPQVQQSVIAKANQIILFNSTKPASAVYAGTPYLPTATGGASGNAVTFTIDSAATAICSYSGGTVSFIGVGMCIIDADQAGNASYNAAAQVYQNFEVGKASQTILFTSAAPGSATVGGATYTPTATGGLSGNAVTFTIDATAASVCSISGGGVVSFLTSGNCVINANQAASTYYNAATLAQQTFAVGKASQTISITSTAPASATAGGDTYNVAATATSGLTVAFTIDSSAAAVCSVTGSTVSFIGTGTCVINANQAGNVSYSAAAQIQQSFAVNKGNQVVSFTSMAPSGAAVGATYTPIATSTSGLVVTITIDSSTASVCTISSGIVTFQTVGTCVINANQAGNTSFNPASQVQQAIGVKSGQVISFTTSAPAGAAVGGTYTPAATSTSGLTVTFTIASGTATNCSISSGVVTFNTVGTCTINANQVGNASFNTASQIQQSIAVDKGSQAIAFTSTAPTAVVGGTYTPTAAATSGLTVAFTIDSASAGICSLSGSTVSFIGMGTCTINADQTGTANYFAATRVQQSFAVGKGSQAITFTSTAPIGALVGGATYTPAATGGTSGNLVVFTIDSTSVGICSISGSTVSFQGDGTCTVNADQAGNTNYNAAAQEKQSFAVIYGKAITAFGFTSPAASGVITGTNIAVTVPFGTNVTALVPTITHNGKSISPANGVPQDYTNPVIYTVTALNDTTQTYTVTVTVALNSAKAITAFSFASPAATGVISGTNITLTVPSGTDFSAIVPTFTHTGASILPAAGVPQNFSSPVPYTVTAADGSSQTYTVTAQYDMNPMAKDITAFSFSSPAATGVINGTNITLTVPYGTNLTSLAANFTTTGASVKVGPVTQISGFTTNNFSSPVAYTVTAGDASTKVYTVTVMQAVNTSKDITAFGFVKPAATGVINGTKITVTVPYGTNLSALVANFTTTGSFVNIGPVVQINGVTVNSFKRPLLYTVTTGDGSTKVYTVTVVVAMKSGKDMTAFNFTNPAVTGVISGQNIVLTVPFGTDLTSLVPTFTTTGVSVKVGKVTQISGTTANNFTSPVVYTVADVNGATKSYTVMVTVAANSAKDITAFSFTNPASVGLISGNNILVTVPSGTNVNPLVATFTTTGSSVRVGAASQVSGTTGNNYTSPVVFTVTAADATTKNYTVTVRQAGLTDKDISAYSFTDPAVTGLISDNNIALTVPYGTDVSALIATFATTGISVKVGSTEQVSKSTPNDFSSSVLYAVTAADGSIKYYTARVITVTRPTLSEIFRSTGPSDGWVLESSEFSGVGGSKNSVAGTFNLGDDKQDRQFRAILHFPTYYLPDNAVVTKVTLMIQKAGLNGTNPFNTHQNISIDIRNPLFGGFDLFKLGSLQIADFQALAEANAVGTILNNPVNNWYSAVLDSSAFPYINLTAVSQLRLAFQLDDNDDQGDDYLKFYSGDAVGQKDRPRLQVEYYVP